jgi:hypothetical protein
MCFPQLDGRQPELFFCGLCEAIMFIAECPLVHVLDISDASAASHFFSIFSQRSMVRDYNQCFPPLFTRYFQIYFSNCSMMTPAQPVLQRHESHAEDAEPSAVEQGRPRNQFITIPRF